MEEEHEMEASGRRAISASYFCLLSFQPEIQNGEEVSKPILEELEVLRLSSALGALPGVNAKDFNYEQLEAKDFDEDLVNCLRTDVFGDDEGELTSPRVRVVGVFGKQAGVKSHLQSIGAWDEAMETHLQCRDIGMYAVMLPPTGEYEDGKTIAVFAWLLDESFEPARLRETPTYLLRLLTCLTNEVVCCLTAEDKTFVEGQVLNQGDHSGGDNWNAYSVAFRVEQQQDQQDDVRAIHVQDLPLPHLDDPPQKISLPRGCYPAVMALADSTDTTDWNHDKKTFQDAFAFAHWILDCATKFRVCASPEEWSHMMVAAVLRRCGMWPDHRLNQLQQDYERSAGERVDMHDFVRRAYLMPSITAGGSIFRVESILDDQQVHEATNAVTLSLRVLDADAGFRIPDQKSTLLWLHIRLPALMKQYYELFTKGKEDELCNLLEQTTTSELRQLVVAGFFDRFVEYMSNLLPPSWRRPKFGELDAFRGRMRVALETMKAQWEAEVQRVFDMYAGHQTQVKTQESQAQQGCAYDVAVAAMLKGSLSELQVQWSSHSDDRMGMSVHVRK